MGGKAASITPIGPPTLPIIAPLQRRLGVPGITAHTTRSGRGATVLTRANSKG